MVQVKVEHVIVVLLGLFLLYHFMGSCGCNKVEGWLAESDNYKYKMPYVMDDGKYCGISQAYNKYYQDSMDQKNLSPTSNLAKAKINLELAQDAKDAADLAKSEADDAVTDSQTQLDNYNESPKPSPSDKVGVKRWQQRRDNLKAELESDQEVQILALAAQEAAAMALDREQGEYDTALENYTTTIQNEHDRTQLLCDKPNRMLNRYGPNYACTNQGNRVNGPDKTFWTNQGVTKYMTIDTADNADTTDTDLIPACEVITPGDPQIVIKSGGPFHGYKFKNATPLARYESDDVFPTLMGRGPFP